MKVKSDHHGNFSNLSHWKEEARKISGLQRDSIGKITALITPHFQERFCSSWIKKCVKNASHNLFPFNISTSSFQ